MSLVVAVISNATSLNSAILFVLGIFYLEIIIEKKSFVMQCLSMFKRITSKWLLSFRHFFPWLTPPQFRSSRLFNRSSGDFISSIIHRFVCRKWVDHNGIDLRNDRIFLTDNKNLYSGGRLFARFWFQLKDPRTALHVPGVQEINSPRCSVPSWSLSHA